MRIVGPVVRTVGALTHTVRDVGRLREVAAILARHGLGLLVAGLDLPGINAKAAYESNPERAVAGLQELGPTFIKLGQVLSTRPDVIPPAYVEAMQTLQDDVDPLPFAGFEPLLVEELGEGWEARFSHVDREPLATASIAQVHRAWLHDGQAVVLKIQRPGIGPKIRSDLSILQFLAARATVEFPDVGLFDPKGILDEFEKSIMGELDFVAEARNLKRFQKNFATWTDIRFPSPIDALCTRRVLCMEFLEGVKIREARAAGFDMEVVGRRALDAVYAMLFTHGFFHGDLHPGNILVRGDNEVGIIDCGMVGRLTDEMKDTIAALIFAMHRGDHRTIARLFFDIAIKEGRVDYDAFERDSIDVMETHWSGSSMTEMQIGSFLMDITRGALKHRVHAPPSFTMFFKAILTAEGLAKSVLPGADPIEAAKPHVDRLLTERWGPDRLTEDWAYRLITLSTLARRLPVSATQLLDDLDGQRLRLNVSLVESRDREAAEDRRHNRMILGLFAMGAALCGTLALFHPEHRIFGLPTIAFTFYSIAAALFLYTLRMMLRNGGR